MGLAESSEHYAEMAQEAGTKKEAAHYWSLYKESMIAMTGDVNMFRKKSTPTSRPSRALVRTLKKCTCGANGIKWSRKEKEYIMDCEHKDPGSYSGHFKDGLFVKKCWCGIESKPQKIGKVVMFSCKCGKNTGWHFSNSDARDEWNNIQDEKGKSDEA